MMRFLFRPVLLVHPPLSGPCPAPQACGCGRCPLGYGQHRFASSSSSWHAFMPLSRNGLYIQHTYCFVHFFIATFEISYMTVPGCVQLRAHVWSRTKTDS
jgi:hypothetical protein